MKNLIDMKLSPEEAKEQSGCSPCLLADDEAPKGPKYPYGLCIYLCDETLAKLNLGELPDVGTTFMLHAMVEVTSNSQRQTQDGKDVSMDLQITSMALEGAVDKSAAQSMYGASNMNS